MLPSRRLAAMSREALGLIETKGMLGAIEVTRAATRAAEVSIASAEHTESGRVIVKIEGDWETVVTAVEAGARAAEQMQQLVSIHVIPRPNEMVSPILPYRLFLDRYFPSGDALPANKPGVGTVARHEEQRQMSPTRVTARPTNQNPNPRTSGKPKNQDNPTSKTPATGERSVVETKIDPQLPEQGGVKGAPSYAELEALPVVKLRQYARTLNNLPIQGRQISMANKQQLLEAIKAIS